MAGGRRRVTNVREIEGGQTRCLEETKRRYADGDTILFDAVRLLAFRPHRSIRGTRERARGRGD